MGGWGTIHILLKHYIIYRFVQSLLCKLHAYLPCEYFCGLREVEEESVNSSTSMFLDESTLIHESTGSENYLTWDDLELTNSKETNVTPKEE